MATPVIDFTFKPTPCHIATPRIDRKYRKIEEEKVTKTLDSGTLTHDLSHIRTNAE